MRYLLVVIFLFYAVDSFSAQWAENLTLKDGKLLFKTSATASVTPTSGYANLYVLPNNRLYFMASDGVVHDVMLGGSAFLNDLLDVDTTNATSGQSLVFNGTNWVNGNISSTLSGLTDVDTTTASSGEFLKFNGLKWVNSVVPQINKLDDIGDVNVTGAVANQVLGFNGTTWVPATL